MTDLNGTSPLRDRLSRTQPTQTKQGQSPLLKKMTGPLTLPDEGLPGEETLSEENATPQVEKFVPPPPRSVSHLNMRYLPMTHGLYAMLPEETLEKNSYEGIDTTRYASDYRQIKKVVDELASQYSRNNRAASQHVVEVAQALLNNKLVTARYLLELFGHLRHMRGDNLVVWEEWETEKRNAATLAMYQYVAGFDVVYEPFLPIDRVKTVAHAIESFLVYINQTAAPDQQQPPTFRAIKQVLLKALSISGLDITDHNIKGMLESM